MSTKMYSLYIKNYIGPEWH